jgi:hypothetical protein
MPARAVDVQDLLHRTQEADDRNALAERNYIFEQRTETRSVDAKGKVKSKEIETFDTIITGDRPYQRLISKNDRPLSAAEEKKEREKQEKEARDRSRETPGQREKALAAQEERRRKHRELAHETLKAFDFRLSGEDADHWILDATPHPGYKPSSRETGVLPHFRGRVWISKKDYVWTRFDAEAIDNISFGLVLARLEKGAHIMIERTRVNDEVWLPLHITGGGAGRIALVKKLRVEFETSCRNFRKFSSNSRLVADPPAEVK